MKTKIFLCASLMLGLSLASCNDDDNYFISTDPVIDQSSVTTGSSDVTANSATLHGTVEGLADKSAAFYSVGFYYGEDQNSLTNRVDGVLDSQGPGFIQGRSQVIRDHQRHRCHGQCTDR